MNPAILARLFQAQQQNQQPQGQPPLDLQQDPGALQWGTGASPHANLDLSQPQESDPGAEASRSSGDMTLPPSDYKYLDRTEGQGQGALGVMFGQDAGQPMGAPQNVPMGALPAGASEGQYISPLDIQQTQRMATRRP